MERAVALKKLGKIFGKDLGYRVDPKAPKQDDRDIARAALNPAVNVRNALQKERDARRDAILMADAEYQRLYAKAREASVHVDRLQSIVHSYKFTVGKSNGMFFHVKAQGDSWEEVIAKCQTAS